ncbi:MAG: Rieske 2Fe-2S domain-containing protein [Actinobacteria bacterium]|nr:Rieske 2Fe-2S domain-containing protein [Actinomycetota bacterium]
MSMELAKDLTRRSLLCGIALIAVGLLPEAANAAVPAVGVKVKGKKLLVDLKANKVLAKVGGVVQIDFSDGSSIALVRTAPGNKGLSAISLACTHQGVTVIQQDKQWVCPAHGSQFALGGALVQGPARSALQKYPITATATTAVIG